MAPSPVPSNVYITSVALIVATGGFLLGFDATVISGAVPFLRNYFKLSSDDGDWKLGLAVSCLGWGAVLGNAIAGFLGDTFGRQKILQLTAVLFVVSALMSALAQNFTVFVVSRVMGGLAVGGVILLAPIYITEISPSERRGRLVSLNQLMIVTGISAAFFSNYLLLKLGENCWRWMLGVEAIPATVYFLLLFRVPESPRWLCSQGRDGEARRIFVQVAGEQHALQELANIKQSMVTHVVDIGFCALFRPRLRRIMLIALTIAFFQQITGINAVLYYLPTIFAQAGGPADASFEQAVIVGIVNLAMTIVAIKYVDRLGRKPLLLWGTLGMTVSLFACVVAFFYVSYQFHENSFVILHSYEVPSDIIADLRALPSFSIAIEQDFLTFLDTQLGANRLAPYHEALIRAGINVNAKVVLVAIICYVASFAVSLGPVMWVLLAEIFPTRFRGKAMSVVGFWNSIVSASVTFLFPWELSHLRIAGTFFLYGMLSLTCLIFVLLAIPETRGQSLEELEELLVKPEDDDACSCFRQPRLHKDTV